MPGEEFKDFQEPRWLVTLSDINRLRAFADRNRLADSAITVRRLLDIAERVEERGFLSEHAHWKEAENG